MISASQYALESSYHPQMDEYDFENKQYIIIYDQQQGTYSVPQVTFEATALTNSNKYINFNESFLTVPLVMTLIAGAGTLTADVRNAFAMSLKNGMHQLISSMQVQISNNDTVNVQQFANMKINYEILSTWGSDDVKTYGELINFHGLDTGLSENYYASANKFGVGSCNNQITPTTTSGWTCYNHKYNSLSSYTLV